MKYIARYSTVANAFFNSSLEELEKIANECFFKKPCNTGFSYVLDKDIFANLVHRYGYGLVNQDDFFLLLKKFLEEADIKLNCSMISAGYNVYSRDGKILGESYLATSGNLVFVIYKDDERILFVNSRRHGIPWLAEEYKNKKEFQVVLYDSQRTDSSWFEAGLSDSSDAKFEYLMT